MNRGGHSERIYTADPSALEAAHHSFVHYSAMESLRAANLCLRRTYAEPNSLGCLSPPTRHMTPVRPVQAPVLAVVDGLVTMEEAVRMLVAARLAR